MAFILIFGAFYAALAFAWGQGLSHWVIDVATVQPAAWLARWIFGDPSIVADGSHLRSAHASMNVLFGCEGTDVLMVLAAALLVAPVRGRDRCGGLIAGAAVVFMVNQLRLLALFFALREQTAWFGPLHGLVAPLGVVVLVSAFFFVWLRRSQLPEAGLASAT